jgi:hypothetical protein
MALAMKGVHDIGTSMVTSVSESKVLRKLDDFSDATIGSAIVEHNTTSQMHYGCVVPLRRLRYAAHFPHAMQTWIPQCWHWIKGQLDANGGKGSCEFYMDYTDVPDKDFAQWRSPWNNELITSLLDCDISFVTSDDIQNLTSTSHEHVFQKAGRLPKDWDVFGKYKSDFLILRQNLVNLRNLNALRPEDAFRIGFVNRRETRHVVNFPELAEMLSSKVGSTTIDGRNVSITKVFMEDMSPMEQFEYWAVQDVVISPHGAALTNAVFMKPRSAIVEIYPEHYYPQFFDPLFKQVGLHHYPYYNGVADPEADFGNHNQTRRKREKWRGMEEMHPPLEILLDLTMKAIDKVLGT